jgi:hypothetical protein
MNSIRLSLGKNSANIQFGKVDGDAKTYLSLAATGPCNKLVFGDLGGKQKTHRCDDAEPLLLTVPAKGFTVYWAVENNDTIEVVRVTVDGKTNSVDMSLAAEGDWMPAASANLAVFPNPEYKFYNYRSEVAAKPLNAPKRPRGRPRKPVAETE